MRPAADPQVLRALELSRQLLEAASGHDMQRVVDLDAERGRILREFLRNVSRIGAAERAALDEIQRLNDQGLASIEQRRREAAEEFANLGRGRRAVNAYASTQGGGE
jgi:hypothetical protein